MLKLPTKSVELQAYYLRKREIEHQRTQKTQAVSRYYDHWGKVTSRHENWTTPEYYKKAEEKVKTAESAKEKRKDLHNRQERLRDMLAHEMCNFEVELKTIEKKKGNRCAQYATDILRKTEERLKQEENVRRKLEMEAKLYGKWRYGVDDEELLFKSKSDNQVLAKLNWLDKQIEEQMEREKEEALAQERALKFQEETRRVEEIQKERQLLREKEMRELRSMQESHLEKIKEHKSESELLRVREDELKHLIKEIEKESELLDESTAACAQNADYDFSHNHKKVKVIIRQRSEDFRKHLQLIIDMLERLSNYASKPEHVKSLVERFRIDLEKEALAMPQFEAMYESEAKQNLQRLEETWRRQTINHYNELKALLDCEQAILTKQLQQNLQVQNELVEVRSHLLSSIDNCSEKLKQLLKESQEPELLPSTEGLPSCESSEKMENLSPRYLECEATLPPPSRTPRNFLNFSESEEFIDGKNFRRSHSTAQRSQDYGGDKFKLSQSFSNLNLVPPSSCASQRELPSVSSNQSMAVVTPDNAEKPKFGRKRIAWT